MQGNPLAGIGYLLQGLGLVFKPRLRRFVMIPLLINASLFAALIWYGAGRFGALLDWLLPDWLDFLSWLLWPLFALTALLIAFYSFTLLANLIAAPFNGLLAEKVEAYLAGKAPQTDSGWGEVLRGIPAAIGSELRKLSYFALRAVPLLILFLIPGLNLLAPFLWLAFSAWFLALEYADFPMANHSLGFKEQHRRLKGQRLTSMGFGAGATLLTLIPLLNFVAVPAAVAGATAFWHARLKSG